MSILTSFKETWNYYYQFSENVTKKVSLFELIDELTKNQTLANKYMIQQTLNWVNTTDSFCSTWNPNPMSFKERLFQNLTFFLNLKKKYHN